MFWYKTPQYKLFVANVVRYFCVLSLKYHIMSAVFGFFILMTILSQLISGTMVAFSLLPEPMLVPGVREEEDMENFYTDDFFWVHERGVDLVFLFSYLHLFRKIFIMTFYFEQEFAWKSGVFSFILFQVVTFLGLVLCCTHLSDVTLSIASNIMHTFFFFTGKVYWWLFTDQKLNTDTLIRLAYLHYISAFYLFYLSFGHAIDMHYDWKSDHSLDGLDQELLWWDEGLANEISSLLDMLVLFFLLGMYLFTGPEALSYEIFMWGDVGLVTDVRFYGVAPHWYFRPFMAWLTVCPFHLTGIFGLILLIFLLFHQPTLVGHTDMVGVKSGSGLNAVSYLAVDRRSVTPYIGFSSHCMFYLFFMAVMYTTTFLPAGRYYNRVQGNFCMLFSYTYIFVFLAFPDFRHPQILESSNQFQEYVTPRFRLIKQYPGYWYKK